MKKSEHALALIKAGISAVPCIGGPIASLISDYVPTATQQSIQTGLELLKERLEKLKDRIDPDVVNKDEFAELFKSCYLSIVRTHQKSKLRAATALITNILLKDGDADKMTYRELDHYTRCIDALSSGAIEILGQAHKITGRPSVKRVESKGVRLDFGQLHKQMNHIAPALLMGLLAELNAVNLIHLRSDPIVRTTNYSNYAMELTPLGVRFVTHILQVPD